MALETFTIGTGLPTWALAVLIVWTLIWKGIALWKSARLSQPIWFIVLLVVNTAGLLEILYIFFLSKIKLEPRKKKAKVKPLKITPLPESKPKRKKKRR